MKPGKRKSIIKARVEFSSSVKHNLKKILGWALNRSVGAATVGRITLNITTHSIMIFSIKEIRRIILWRMTLNLTTLSRLTLYKLTLRIMMLHRLTIQ